MKKLMLSLVMSLTLPAFAAPNKIIEAKEAYVFVPLKGTNATAGYGSLKNLTTKEVSLTLEKAEGFKAVELHETISKDGMMKMQKLEKAVIPAKGSFELKPGGNHVMLFDATKEFKVGDTTELQFDVGGKKVSLPFMLKARTESKSEEHHHHH